MKKELLKTLVKELPPEFDLDALMEKLLVIEKIEKGLEDVKSGNTVSHSKVKNIIAKWSK